MSNEPLPDTTNTRATIRYIQGQAAQGHFAGHSSSMLVLYYLVTYMWVSPTKDGDRGDVMHGKSGIDDIMAGTGLSRSSAQRALKWLADEEWVDTQRQLDDHGREVNRSIYLKLDVTGHRERERARAAKARKLRLVEGSREGVNLTHPRVSA